MIGVGSYVPPDFPPAFPMKHPVLLALAAIATLGLRAAGAGTVHAPVRAQETAAPARAVADERHADVTAALRAEFERQGLVGLSVAVVEGDTITEFHFGHADREGDVEAGPDTLYRWASISKPVTAVRAMQLALDGQLDLDADVRTLVPEFPEKPWPVTSRQLMGHLGGVVHYRNGKVVRTEREYESDHPFEDVILALDTFKESPLVAEPGTEYAYTTHGYILLGAVVQRAGEAPYWDQVEGAIAARLGMETFRPDYQWLEIANRAVGYRKLAGEVFRSGDSDVSWKLPGGGYLSNVFDLALFAKGLMGDRLLPEDARRAMWRSMETRDGEETGYGMGFGVKLVGERLRVSHGGSQQKTRTLMQLFPDEGRAVVLMTNSEYAKVGPIADVAWGALDG